MEILTAYFSKSQALKPIFQIRLCKLFSPQYAYIPESLGGEDTVAQVAVLTVLLRTALHPLLQHKRYSSYSGLPNPDLNFQLL